MRPLHPRRTSVVAALDIGTSKVACLIARLKPLDEDDLMRGRSHSIELIGFGQTRSRGLKAGTVTDMEKAEAAIRRAVDLAERSAKVEIASVALAISGGRLLSESFTASVRLPGPAVEEGDVGRVLDAASLHSVREGHAALASEASGERGHLKMHAPDARPAPGSSARGVLHSLPVGYALDGVGGIADPRGMLGRVLSVDLHVVTAALPALKNLVLCVERCHLSVEGLIAAPYAAGLAVLAADEMEMGATVIDLGAGTTSAAVFAGSDCVHVDCLALGGQQVTMDLARGISTRIAEAERLKTLYGSVLGGEADETDLITVPAVELDANSGGAVSRSQIVRLVRPRVEEILELLRDRFAAANVLVAARRRIVLTGAAAQLTGLNELAGRVFNTGARIGRPLGMRNFSEQARGPAFAVAAGLLVYPQFAGREHFEPRRRCAAGEGNYLVRVGRWLRESF
jgi:cell division protein FtsA